jgi:hypothetical protein
LTKTSIWEINKIVKERKDKGKIITYLNVEKVGRMNEY